MLKTNIIVKLRVEGIHNWEGCDVEGVEFLKHDHRHIFHIEAKKKVEHNDRDIEIISFKRDIEKYLKEKYNGQYGSRSCEMIALELLEVFNLNYCSVLEDGENGAEVVGEAEVRNEQYGENAGVYYE